MPTQRPTGLLALLCLCMAIGMTTLTATLVTERNDVQQSLSNTIDAASQTYRERTSASAMKSFQEKVLKEMRDRLTVEGKAKRAARFALAYAKNQLRNLEENQMERANDGRREALTGVGESEDRMNSLIRQKFVSSVVEDNGGGWIRAVMSEPEGVMDDGTRKMLLKTYGNTWNDFVGLTSERTVDILRVELAAKNAKEDVYTKEADLNVLRTSYLDDLRTSERAQNGVILSDRELARAKAEAVEIHRTVLRMQAELARIDAQLRGDAQQSLLDMGLLSAAPEDPVTQPLDNTFLWPVRGNISAGYHNELYKQFFGIPHNGVDIMTDQGTPVHSAADGIVFLVKDGGALGYTYVLIGHRDGYATLYGHLSLTQVAPGQEIHKGDVIGLSGGTPGTPGAGPTTTGPHLHFEVILNGSNIDPMTILANAAAV